MHDLMQDWPLTLDRLIDNAARWHGATEIVSRNAAGRVTRTDYAAVQQRAKQVSNALLAHGIGVGDRVATLAWNGARHLEILYGTIGIGAVNHTLNPRLFAEQVAYIADHAADRMIFADPACAPLLETILPQCPTVEAVVFLCEASELPATSFAASAYEDWLQGHTSDCRWGGFDERTAAGLCYTSGTTGNPKGVLYGHRSNYLHALMTLQPDGLALSARDTVLLVVPMYHANAWGVIYSAPMVGAKLVLPGQRLDGASIHELLESEGVTYSAAVPTVWQMLLDHLRTSGGKLTTLQRVTIGGAACPESIIRAFHDDYGVDVIQGWGMTETSPLATIAQPTARLAGQGFEAQVPFKLKQGRLLCSLDLALAGDDNERLPHDGKTPGRLLIKGPTVTLRYFGADEDAVDADGWFDTGDIATLDSEGVMQITDRAKDVIKSGGEWISSIDIENIAVGHPQVVAAGVIGVAHPKWDERPALFVELQPGATVDAEAILAYLEGKIARWWMPDHVLFVDQIPLGPTGKIDKRALRIEAGKRDLASAVVNGARCG